MSQWKIGDGEYIPAHDMDGTTLLAKHNVPHTPTPSLSHYELSGQGHTYVHPTTPWMFDDQRRQKHYPTTNTESSTRSDGAISYQQQIPGTGNKQHWTRQGKPSNKPPPPMDYTSSPLYSTLSTNTHSDDGGGHKSSSHQEDNDNDMAYASSITPSSSLIHPLTNIYVDLHTDESSVRIMPSQVIPPVTLPTNENRDHRVGSQGMVGLDNQQNSMKQHPQHHLYHPQYHQHMHQQLTPRSEHSHYSDDRDIHHHHHHHHRATKHAYSRSFSDTPHSLLPYHHHSSQHRHNSIATPEQTAVREAGVKAAAVAAYQPHSMNSGQMTWYTQNSTFHKTTNPIYSNSATSSPRVPSSISRHPNDSEIYQDSDAVANGANFAPMPDLLSSSARMDHVDYGVHSSTASTSTTNTSTHGLGPQRHSNQWTSSSSSSSPRINDMHSLISLSFSPNDTSYNNSDACTSMDQQSNDEEKNNPSMVMATSTDALHTPIDASNKLPAAGTAAAAPAPADTTMKKRTNKKSAAQRRTQKPHTGKRRSPNAFFVFCAEKRQILKQGKPNARNTDINRQLGDDWKALTQEERDWYKQRADRIRAEYPTDTTTSTLTTGLLTHNDTPSITFTTAPTPTNDGSDHPAHLHPPTFDLPFNDFADAHSPGARGTRNTSRAMTIAVDDDSVISDGTNGDGQPSKRGSLTSSDLSTSFSSPSSQRPLNVASLSGAAEANALDQATLVGFHSSNTITTNHNNNSNRRTSEKPERLKRPPNAYLLFNREMRRKLLDQNENLTVALISKSISQSWHDLPQETKDGYIKAAAKLKQQHLEDHPNYVYSRRSRSELAQAGYRSRPSKKRKTTTEDTNGSNSNDVNKDVIGDAANETNDPDWLSSASPSTTGTLAATVTATATATPIATPTPTPTPTAKGGTKQQRRFPDPRGRKKKKHKNPLGPKHPMSGFLFFASYARPDAVRQHPKSNVGMISKVIAEQWKKMTDQDKQPWVEKAQADKARYAKEMEEFNLAQAQKEQQQQQQQQRKRMYEHDDTSGYTNDISSSVDQRKKRSISSQSSNTTTDFRDDHHASESLSLAALGSRKSLDSHNRHHPFDYSHLHHHHHHTDMDRHRNNGFPRNNHYSKHSYKPVSRIHSALVTSRPASPTELDSHTIATVAQMVNPKNHTPVPIPSSASNGSTSSGFHQQHSSNTPTLTSIMHHHDGSSISSLKQLHVPATPPSPAIDTI